MANNCYNPIEYFVSIVQANPFYSNIVYFQMQTKILARQLSDTLSNGYFNSIFTIEDERNEQSLAAASHGDNTNNKLKKILPNPSPNYIHKPIKTGKQRFRWNLMFNLLVWLIVPMPLWMPFVSQTVACYLIPSVQALFVLMWVIVVILASKNMLILYRYLMLNL